MSLVTDNETLRNACNALAKEAFVTLDTEFHREAHYFPKLCLIQVAGNETIYIIDPLVKELDLTPFFELLTDDSVLKVMHSGVQDIEILFKLIGKMPTPIFDTQIAAMVCGYGANVGYSQLVKNITETILDKTMCISNWETRPLSEQQLKYAGDDVKYLRDVYSFLKDQIESNDRVSWIAEEMDKLSDENNYIKTADSIWQKIKVRDHSPSFLQRLKYLAKWREEEAMARNTPRNWVIKDTSLVEIAALNPKGMKQLRSARQLARLPLSNEYANAMIEVLQSVAAMGKIDEDVLEKINNVKPTVTLNNTGCKEMLKLLLKIQASKYNVAEKLIIDSQGLSLFADQDAPNIPAMQGWRYEVFGRQAQALKQGKIMFGIEDGEIFLREV